MRTTAGGQIGSSSNDDIVAPDLAEIERGPLPPAPDEMRLRADRGRRFTSRDERRGVTEPRRDEVAGALGISTDVIEDERAVSPVEHAVLAIAKLRKAMA